MSFHNWYAKSIEEAQERYKKEANDKEKEARMKAYNERRENDLHDANYGSIDVSNNTTDDEEWWGI